MCAHRVAPPPLRPLKRVSTSSLEKGIFSISSILAEGESTLSLSSCSPRATRPSSSSSLCPRKRTLEAGRRRGGSGGPALELNNLRRNETLPNLESPAVEVLELQTQTMPSHVSTFLRARQRRQDAIVENADETG